jgi:archaemetzincin
MVLIVRAGRTEDDALAIACDAVERVLGCKASIGDGTLPIESMRDPERRQYNSTLILRVLAAWPHAAARVLALTEEDLYIPMLSFVFGLAQVGGPVAVVSTARLRQGFYGLRPDRERFEARLRKGVLHELGHTFGLVHCPDRACVMALASSLQQLDAKGGIYCAGCQVLLREQLHPAVV